MSETRTADNEMVNSAKSLIRTARSRGITVSSVDQNLAEQILASKSLFELADAIHLGRSSTRAKVRKVVSAFAAAVELADRKELK